MDIILRKPRTGKTTELIKQCSENDGYILVPTRIMADNVYKMAREQGYDIRFPVTLEEMLITRGHNGNSWIKGIYIDNAEMILQAIVPRFTVKTIVLDDLGNIAR